VWRKVLKRFSLYRTLYVLILLILCGCLTRANLHREVDVAKIFPMRVTSAFSDANADELWWWSPNICDVHLENLRTDLPVHAADPNVTPCCHNFLGDACPECRSSGQQLTILEDFPIVRINNRQRKLIDYAAFRTMDIVYVQTHTGVLEPAAMLDAFDVPFAMPLSQSKRDRLCGKVKAVSNFPMQVPCGCSNGHDFNWKGFFACLFGGPSRVTDC
jgi:hypothetical protein